ncbi:cob(I)alamin adenosyltransferase [Candidatus Kryptonium thompsonii]|uniref:Corrinoid adenosyltransferase n=1 Tax=Candidatus Kryptonium thompsonii TaxID=1633631 RepID=A0A0P1LKA5_9BACT|nr:cob(I)yrinic acid a,c-diamide adenosyltransferase [Candidatus Kryptonium thompsoni]CUS77941.1 cob(I)alamin adenosyltransferase [Candidatus Kryptonium thompsoni]CUS82246.1 cob(I)alamin adenosyltransferase [Candidatus Kryptonium thompsoni]CUS85707.1 cob(I)alamin adenosyltransferase [Candidatus Kryptonium thompsoni]CUS88398.1 cob(I)alamin adenosyltransferase [Candidatus Kryptonium thompsoni]CUS95085.1 cob(I)alamin adenosyltransferase [Candidatus Kryptonium thompsoni]
MKIYTRTGDDGTTSIFAGGRVKKNDARVEAYGTIDEFNSILGIARAVSKNEFISGIIRDIQNLLFVLGSDLATPIDVKNERVKRISKDDIEMIEKLIDEIDKELSPLKNFILPGGTLLASLLHHARTVCRRAERRLVSLSEKERINEHVIPFVNRLSDLLFVLARYANKIENVDDIKWTG